MAEPQQAFKPNNTNEKIIIDRINEHGQALEMTMLRFNQQQQTIDQYRVNIYNLELKVDLMNKMMEEKGLFAKGELDQRWPLYLKNVIGVLGPDGKMEGSLKVQFFNGGKK